MPKYKTSALRGGMGEMLTRAFCIKDRDCDVCDFYSECIVQKIMYLTMEIPCKYASGNNSVGYVIECEDYRTEFNVGDTLKFNIILFGKTILYFNQILNAFYNLGRCGLGNEKAKFDIISVTNTKKESLLYDNNVLMENYKILLVSDYIEHRRCQLKNEPLENVIKVQSPLALKHNGVELDNFDILALIKSLQRRIYTLDCFEGIDSNIVNEEIVNIPKILEGESRKVEIKRYSFRKESYSILKGIEGTIRVSAIPDDLLDLFLAGELVHVGKNTSFGFGRYRVL